jgi:hypothetical protein
LCPNGTVFLPFYPEVEETPGEQVSVSDGYACYPPDKVPDVMFGCDFDAEKWVQIITYAIISIKTVWEF